ncbi:hypothetical protein ACU8KH_01986 [Lachancea thermotolerans]
MEAKFADEGRWFLKGDIRNSEFVWCEINIIILQLASGPLHPTKMRLTILLKQLRKKSLKVKAQYSAGKTRHKRLSRSLIRRHMRE